MITREDAQRQVDEAVGAKQRLEYQRSQLNKRSPLYRARISGIEMQLTEVNKDLATANGALAQAIQEETQK